MEGDEPIEGLKLIRMTGTSVDEIDDDRETEYLHRLEVNLRAPELMQIAFIMLYGGSEEFVVRAKTREALDQFVTINKLRTHPRLRRMTFTGPDGVREEFTR